MAIDKRDQLLAKVTRMLAVTTPALLLVAGCSQMGGDAAEEAAPTEEAVEADAATVEEAAGEAEAEGAVEAVEEAAGEAEAEGAEEAAGEAEAEAEVEVEAEDSE